MSQTSRNRVDSRRVRIHEKNSGDAVRRLGTIIQSIFCAQSGASIHLTVWKWSGESRYPGALPPVLENFHRAFSPGPTDCPWVSEDERPLTLKFTVREYRKSSVFPYSFQTSTIVLRSIHGRNNSCLHGIVGGEAIVFARFQYSSCLAHVFCNKSVESETIRKNSSSTLR